jgi:hypothetical protein
MGPLSTATSLACLAIAAIGWPLGYHSPESFLRLWAMSLLVGLGGLGWVAPAPFLLFDAAIFGTVWLFTRSARQADSAPGAFDPVYANPDVRIYAVHLH